jgi:hypothetical protein
MMICKIAPPNGLDAFVVVPVATTPVGSFALIMGIYE